MIRLPHAPEHRQDRRVALMARMEIQIRVEHDDTLETARELGQILGRIVRNPITKAPPRL